ncbi:GNAT family N-acetyltransferase [Candidatus Micrarchaeota archaeon]|nr:GNAT family N-acetyltransferase [Candidatus Micrarchaeota archaeon]
MLEKLYPKHKEEVALLLSQYLENGYKAEIKGDGLFAMKSDGEFAGTISPATDVSNVAEIRDMVVTAEHRSQGIGSDMLRELVLMARQRNIRKLFALAFPEFEGLYAGQGFEKEGTLKSNYAEGEGLPVMGLSL